MINIHFNDFFVHVKANFILRTHALVLKCTHKPKHDSFRYFFCNRIVSVCNLLPESLVNSTTSSAFKKRLNKFDVHSIIFAHLYVKFQKRYCFSFFFSYTVDAA